MKVLLIQPKFTYTEYMQVAVEMPLGLCYLASVARKKGHTVKIIDCLAEGFFYKEKNGNLITYGLPDDIITRKIQEFKPDVIGCSALFSAQYENARKLCELVKKINSKIITVTGGMHPTVCPVEVLSEKSIDFIFQGEADYTFSEFLDALENHTDYAHIDGIGYKDNGNIHINKKEKFIENLDEVPFPARDLLNIACYHKVGLAHGFVLKHKKNINLITSRGCPGKCIFCTIHLIWGRKFRSRSPENVLSELEQIKKNYKVRHIQFEDDNLTHDIVRAKKIFRGMIEKKLNFKWNTPNGVALWCMDMETLDLMKKAGCYYVKFAVESGNQRVLKEVVRKPQNLDRAVSLIKHAWSIGLRVGSFFVVGFPGETKEEMQDTFNFPYKVKLDYTVYAIAKPSYGTELRKICEEKNYLKKYTELDFESGKACIETPEFTAEWLERKVENEQKRYVKHLLLHQPGTILTIGWMIFKREPFFIIKYLSKVFGFSK